MMEARKLTTMAPSKKDPNHEQAMIIIRRQLPYWMEVRRERTPAAMARELRARFFTDVRRKIFPMQTTSSEVIGQMFLEIGTLADRVERCPDCRSANELIRKFKEQRPA